MCYVDLRRQKIDLSMEIREQLDVEKNKYATNYEQELQDIVSERKLTACVGLPFLFALARGGYQGRWKHEGLC